MSKLFNVAENNITYHLQNIFKTNEFKNYISDFDELLTETKNLNNK